MAKVLDCSNHLPSFLEAASEANWAKATHIYDEISRIENQADDDKRSIRLHLPKSLFMPISRHDLLDLLSRQDDVANCAKDIAGIVLGRKMEIPASIKDTLKNYVEASLNAVSEAHTIVNELDELIETGFGGREIDWVEKLITRLDEIESQSDLIQINIRSKLHEIEQELSPVDVMFMYKIFELIGNLADCAKRVGDQIHIIVAR
jgi:predicted phosphate transport protein (TIGR00153 family)